MKLKNIGIVYLIAGLYYMIAETICIFSVNDTLFNMYVFHTISDLGIPNGNCPFFFLMDSAFILIGLALVFANLINVYLKTGIGRLSAYCGAVCAGKSAWAGIAFINKDSLEVISDLITNGIATDSGIICDGAKESCASILVERLEHL